MSGWSAAAAALAAAWVQEASAAPTTPTGSKAPSSGVPATTAPASRAPAPASRKPAAAPPSVSEVTVTAAAQGYRGSIDRKSYSLVDDLQATTGSLADVLRNVPSVDVDVQGNISLRGDSSVTILVDGQPSALFQGPQRADALQQLPADQYERVEVMTNPSAAFKPDGSGGIINLISKKSAPGARTGSIKANVGTDGRVNGSVSGGYNSKKLSLSGSFGARHDRNSYETSTTQQVIDPATGGFAPLTSFSHADLDSTSYNGRVGIDYDLTPHDRLSASGSLFDSAFSQDGAGAFRSALIAGAAAQDYDTRVRVAGDFKGGGGQATWLHRFAGEGHELSVRVGHNGVSGQFSPTFDYSYLRPAGTTLFQTQTSSNDNSSTQVKVEYKRPFSDGAKLVVGYELNADDGRFDRQGLLGATAATAAPIVGLNNLFEASQTVHAWYATYERAFGKLTVLPGLRLEEVEVDTNQRTSRIVDGFSYFDAYPTLHLAWKLDETRTLSASFSRRVNRPGLQSLNPFLVFNGPLSFSQGDNRLRPAKTESYELGYEYRKGQTYHQATLFLRNNHDTAVDISRDLGGGVLLETQANLGSSRSAGLELVANGRLGTGTLAKAVSFNASVTPSWNEVDPQGLAFTAARSLVTVRARASVNWTATKADFIQANVNLSADQLTPQGRTEGGAFAALGYRHTFNDRLALVATANDPFDWSRSVTVIDTPQLKQRSEFRFHARSFYLGLTYALGAPGKRRQPEAFDFGGGGGAGGGAGGGPPVP